MGDVVILQLGCGHRTAALSWGQPMSGERVCGQCPEREIAGMKSLAISNVIGVVEPACECDDADHVHCVRHRRADGAFPCCHCMCVVQAA